MNRLKSLIVRAIILVAIAGSLPTSSTTASAQEPSSVFSDTLLITGGTTALICLQNCGGAANKPIQGGLGAYSLRAKLCTLTSDAAVEGEGGALMDLMPLDCLNPPSWVTNGTYNSVICGTGTIHGISISSISAGPDETFNNLEYWATFAAGVGVLTGNVTEVEQNGAVSYLANLTGTMSLEPLQPLPVPPNCMTGFRFKAMIHVSQSVASP